jgi:hypothetical protein
MTLANFGWRLAQLKREQEQQERFQIDSAWYSFLARPTCPPSTSMTIHGGTCIESKSQYNMDDVDRHNGLAWTVPNMVKDLADPTDARVDMGMVAAETYTALSWTQANSYKGGILLLLLPDVELDPGEDDWRLRLYCYPEEYTTISEAEERLISWLWEEEWIWDGWFDGHYWPDAVRGGGATHYYQESGMPLCGIILRNNGTVGTGRHFMEIDVLNRGRSYTWPRDMRPQWVNK